MIRLRESFEIMKRTTITRRFADFMHFGEFPFELSAVISKCDFVISDTIFSVKRLEPSIALYRKLGFKEIPLKNNAYERCDILMELLATITIPTSVSAWLCSSL